eukprot:8564341-Alexandrium_andersonii.AAC.1
MARSRNPRRRWGLLGSLSEVPCQRRRNLRGRRLPGVDSPMGMSASRVLSLRRIGLAAGVGP